MLVNSIHLVNFRNYSNLELELSPGINVITGENAQGKTNLLEAVFMLSCGHGFRTRFDKELIFFGEDYARITGEVFSSERNRQIDIMLGSGTRKQICLNGVKKNASELPDALKTVLFCPDDLNMIKEGAKERRRFLDMAIAQLRPGYGKLLGEYNRLFEHKKSILSDWHEKPSLLDALDEYSDLMCRVSAKLIRYRAAFCERLQSSAAPIHSQFSGSGEELKLLYQTVSTVKDPFASEMQLYRELSEHQAAHRQAEIASGNVLTGIHKDDLEISINGVAARQFASQGQTRTAALSLKMAECEISTLDTGETPVLLLDDVLSELDQKRQEYVLNRIGGGQTLISCCEDGQIRSRTGGRVFTVNGGRVV